MQTAWQIGRAFGIPIRIHWSFLLLPAWILLAQAGSGTFALFSLALTLTLAMFGCVILHELGHALAARGFGIRTQDITIYPIGGVARLEGMGQGPWQEFCIAVAGPAVNVAIAVVLLLSLAVGVAVHPALLTTLGGLFAWWLMLLNLLMVAFNLLPAFPMDGGRVLRAGLASFLGQLRATRIAATVGAILAVVGGVAGTLYLQNPWLMIVAFFVYVAGQQELAAVEMRERLRHADRSPPFAGHWPDGGPPHGGLPHDGLQPRVIVYVWDPRSRLWVPRTS